MDREQLIEEDGIDLIEIYYLLRRHLIPIVLAGVLGCIVGFGYTQIMVEPQYEAWTTMIVNNSKEENTTGTLTTSQIDSATSLIDTYAIIIKSDRVLNRVIDRMDLNVHYSYLASKITVTSVDDTQIMRIAFADEDPDFAYEFIQVLADEAPEIIIDVVEAGSVKTITEPQMPGEAMSTNLLRNTVLLSLACALAVAGFVVLKSLLDTRIKSESDMERIFTAPVLGVIPTIESCEKIRKGGYYGK